jgi:hypothetical protein
MTAGPASGASFYTGTAGGVKRVDWFTKNVHHQAPGNARPSS